MYVVLNWARLRSPSSLGGQGDDRKMTLETSIDNLDVTRNRTHYLAQGGRYIQFIAVYLAIEESSLIGERAV